MSFPSTRGLEYPQTLELLGFVLQMKQELQLGEVLKKIRRLQGTTKS